MTDKNSLISQYWLDFESGNTWNYHSYPLRFVENDTWTTNAEWIERAEHCIQMESNTVQALSILLSEGKDNYLPLAESVVKNWFDEGCHDEGHYYELISLLPNENSIRKEFFDISNYCELIDTDHPDNAIARRALISVGDKTFIDFLTNHIDSSLDKAGSNKEFIEQQIFPLLIDFGSSATSHISETGLNSVRELFDLYLERDQILVEKIIDGYSPDEDERVSWIREDIAYYAWSIGLSEYFNSLIKQDWYWAIVFSEIGTDSDNNNLLAWSTVHKNKTLENRAKWVTAHHDYQNLDGAIALSRIL